MATPFASQNALVLANLYYNQNVDRAVRHAVNMGAISVCFGEWTAFVCDSIMMRSYTLHVGVNFSN